MDADTSVWFVTGCSSGFGREIANAVLARGDRAVLTARDPGKIADLAEGYEDNCLILPLDITDEVRIGQAVKQAEVRFGRIDVLVNNAGLGYYGAIEEGEADKVRDLFETNVFGTASMIRAVLPGMRGQRSGTIVNLGSVGGLIGFSGVGYYSATKFAIEGMSDALANETRPLGIKVMVVEPGSFRTKFLSAAKFAGTQIAEYADIVPGRGKIPITTGADAPGDPAKAAEAIVHAVHSGNPPRHLVLGAACLGLVRAKLDRVRKDIDDWAAVTGSVDFPK